MTRAEFNELGITEEQYETYFGEKVSFDEVETSVVEEVEVVAEAEEPSIVETSVEPTEASLSFDNIKAAATFLAGELNLKVTNTLDCLYKCLKSSHKTHNYSVERLNDKSVVLTPIA